jgi:hypothetical protein
MITKISCPACGGKGRHTSLEADCTYCAGKKRVPLVPYLRLIGHEAEALNAEHFQKRMGKHRPKQKDDHRQNGFALKVN